MALLRSSEGLGEGVDKRHNKEREPKYVKYVRYTIQQVYIYTLLSLPYRCNSIRQPHNFAERLAYSLPPLTLDTYYSVVI